MLKNWVKAQNVAQQNNSKINTPTIHINSEYTFILTNCTLLTMSFTPKIKNKK